jgi:uncharacterized membrane protein
MVSLAGPFTSLIQSPDAFIKFSKALRFAAMTIETSTTPSGSRHMSRGLKFALFASLALNAIFIGGLVSAFVRHGGAMMLASAQAPGNLGAYVATLSNERGKALWQSVSELRRAVMPLRQEVRRARREALAMLTAEPFDRAKFVEAQTRLIEAENRQRLGQRDILAGIAGGMTADERRAYIRWRAAQSRPGSDDSEAATPGGLAPRP